MVVATFVVAEPVEQAAPPMPGFAPRADATAHVTELAPLDREALITRHLPLVRHVANSMRHSANPATTLDYDNLLGFGTEGLIAAVDSFDPAYNVRFSTWAVLHIRTTIQDALRRLDPLPRSLRAQQKALARVQTALAQTRGAWPSDSDVAQELGISVQHLDKLQQDLTHTVVSLDQCIDGNDEGMGATWLMQLADADPGSDPQGCLDTVELRRALRQAILTLPARELTIATLHYGQNQSLHAISVRLGVSPSRVSQLHTRMLALLRSTMVELLEGAR